MAKRQPIHPPRDLTMADLIEQECHAIANEGVERDQHAYVEGTLLTTNIRCGLCKRSVYIIAEAPDATTPGALHIGCRYALGGGLCTNDSLLDSPEDIAEARYLIEHFHDIIPGPDPKLVERFKRLYTKAFREGMEH